MLVFLYKQYFFDLRKNKHKDKQNLL